MKQENLTRNDRGDDEDGRIHTIRIKSLIYRIAGLFPNNLVEATGKAEGSQLIAGESIERALVSGIFI